MKKYINIVQQMDNVKEALEGREEKDGLRIWEKNTIENWDKLGYPNQELMKELTELNMTADNISDHLKIIKASLIILILAVGILVGTL